MATERAMTKEVKDQWCSCSFNYVAHSADIIQQWLLMFHVDSAIS